MQEFIECIGPKLEEKSKSALVEKLILAKQHQAFFMDVFLKSLLDYKLAIFFDNTISLEELIYQLRLLVVQNHVAINTLGNELVEYDSTNNVLHAVGAYMKKAGYVLVDFDSDPNIYYLSAVPLATKSVLESKSKELGLYLEFF